MATRDRTVLVRLKANATDFNRAMVGARMAVRGLRDEIDTTNDRTAWLAQGILALGPTLAPIGAAAVPVLTGLATQLTAVGLAAGVTGLAFNGVGDALGALNDYQLEPTTANMDKLSEAMGKVGPEGEEFVRFVDSLGPQFAELSNLSREGMFPGMTEGIGEFMRLMPQVADIVHEVSVGMGELASNTGKGLNNERFAAFFDYLESTAKPTLVELGHSLGNLAEGFASIMVAFGPLSSDFSAGLESMTASFADWAAGLSETQGFSQFVAYIREAGPKVLDFMGSFSTAFLEVMEAAAPIGDIMLPMLSALFDVIATLADTPLGPAFLGVAAAMSLYGRAAALASITTGGLGGKMLALSKSNAQAAFSFKGLGTNLGVVTRNMLTAGTASERMRTQTQAALAPMKAQGKAMAGFAGQAALLGVVTTGAADKMGLANTASLALAGSLFGPVGAGVGAAAGALLDLKEAGSGAYDALAQLKTAVEADDINAISAAIAEQQRALDDMANTDWSSLSDFGGDFAATVSAWMSGDRLAGSIEKQEKAIEAAKEHKAALQDAAERSRQLDVAMARSAESAEAQRRALQATSEAASKTAGSFMAFGDSLDDSEVSLGDWIAEMERSAAALANFAANSRKAAKRGLDEGLIASLQEAGEAGAMRMQQLADASQEEIGRANRAWRKGEGAIGDYIHMVNGVPTKASTYLELADQAAKNALEDFRAKVDHATRRRIIVIDVQGRMPKNGQWGISADGGTVPKTGLPYADRHPYLLADGEEVISNRRGQADKNRHALKAANAGAKLAVVGYADGGTAGKNRPRSPLRTGVFVPPGPDRLDAAIAALAAAVQDQTEMLSNAEAARDEVLGRMQSLADATAALFDTPLFQQASDPWAAGAAGGPLGNIAGDIAGLEQRQLLQDQLKALGMEGDALAALLSQGSNADIAGMIARGEVDQYADLYRRRAALQESVGASAGEMAYGRDLAKLTPAVEAITTELHSMQGQLERMEKRAAARNADYVELFADAVNGAATKGHKERRDRANR